MPLELGKGKDRSGGASLELDGDFGSSDRAVVPGIVREELLRMASLADGLLPEEDLLEMMDSLVAMLAQVLAVPTGLLFWHSSPPAVGRSSSSPGGAAAPVGDSSRRDRRMVGDRRQGGPAALPHNDAVEKNAGPGDKGKGKSAKRETTALTTDDLCACLTQVALTLSISDLAQLQRIIGTDLLQYLDQFSDRKLGRMGFVLTLFEAAVEAALAERLEAGAGGAATDVSSEGRGTEGTPSVTASVGP